MLTLAQKSLKHRVVPAACVYFLPCLISCLLLTCGRDEGDDGQQASPPPSEDDSADAEAKPTPTPDPTPSATASRLPVWLADCRRREPAGGVAAVDTIAELIAHINALPRPTTLACLLASLPRPLPLRATSNALSAQPAAGPDSPRLFARLGDLVLSVVPDGIGRNNLELAELVAPGLTLKGELWFPVPQAKTLTTADAFDHLAASTPGGPTLCAACHSGETAANDPRYPATAAVSQSLKPAPATLVPLATVERLTADCLAMLELRCQIFHGLTYKNTVADFPDLPGMTVMGAAP
jgi:hypothetical protein